MPCRAATYIVAFLALAGAVTTAAADSVEDFYRGKTLDLIIPSSPGGDYDIRGRMIARYMGRFIPGHPNIVARNMPAGVGIQAANHMAKVAPRDGTVLHIIFQSMPSYQAMGGQAVEFDVRKFGWIGNTTDSPNVVNSWYTTGIKTIQDVMEKELVVGAPGTGTTSYIYPAAMNALAGTKFKIVTGYPGGNDVNLAMEKGEVGGRGSNSWASWKSGHPEWITEKKIYILVQIGLRRASDLADVPLMSELAKNDEDQARVLTFYFLRYGDFAGAGHDTRRTARTTGGIARSLYGNDEGPGIPGRSREDTNGYQPVLGRRGTASRRFDARLSAQCPVSRQGAARRTGEIGTRLLASNLATLVPCARSE